VILLANIQTMEPRMLVSLLFHELGHCLKDHATEPKEGRPALSLRQEKEAEKFAVIDYIKYYGKGAVVPQDPRIGEGFYRSLGLKKIMRKADEATSRNGLASSGL
jgi:hypothetical protein